MITAAVFIAPAAAAGSGFLGLGKATAATASAFAATASTVVGSVGISLVLGGIAQAISPQPNTGLERSEEAAKLESFLFSNVVNTARQGLPVPIAYGRVFVGSAVLSSALDVDQKQA